MTKIEYKGHLTGKKFNRLVGKCEEDMVIKRLSSRLYKTKLGYLDIYDNSGEYSLNIDIIIEDNFVIIGNEIYKKLDISGDKKLCYLKDESMLEISDIDVLDLGLEMLSKIVTNKGEFYYKRLKKE